MRIRCPHCETLYDLADPVAPPRRLRLRCAVCNGVIELLPPADELDLVAPAADDVMAWRRTLARALVSDLRAYAPEEHARALAEDRLLEFHAEGLAEAWLRFRTGADTADAGVFRAAAREVLGEGREVLPDLGHHPSA